MGRREGVDDEREFWGRESRMDGRKVDGVEVGFGGGFTVLTGETWAGKEILIDELSLSLGERSDAGQVRNGSKRAEISAEFDVSESPELLVWLRENDLEGHGDEDNVCLMRRVMSAIWKSALPVSFSFSLKSAKLIP